MPVSRVRTGVVSAPPVFVERGDQQIGSIYRKAAYRAYTDASFTTLEPRDPDLGFLGAVIRIADMVPDNPATWFYPCHVNDYILAGMQTLFRVTAGSGAGTDPVE